MKPIIGQANLGSLAIATQEQRIGSKVALKTPIQAEVLHADITPVKAQVAPAAQVGIPMKFRVDAVRVLDPALSKAISSIPLPVVGVPRDKIKVPISTNSEPSERFLLKTLRTRPRNSIFRTTESPLSLSPARSSIGLRSARAETDGPYASA